MTGLFGFFGPPTHPDELRSIAARMAESCDDAHRVFHFGARSFVGVGSGVTTSELHTHDGVTMALCGVPRIGAVEPTPHGLTTESARHFIGEYRTKGTGALASLSGAFSIALLDERRETLLLAIDSIGIEQLFYRVPSRSTRGRHDCNPANSFAGEGDRSTGRRTGPNSTNPAPLLLPR
jgi:hypothetical protein